MNAPQLSIAPNPHRTPVVVFEDEHFLAVDKPAGVVTQPGVGHDRDTLLNGLFATHGRVLQNLGRARDFGLVHRLDAPTSGLVLVGLTHAGYDGLRRQFAERTIEKTYLALVHGAPRADSGTERTPVREARVQGRKRALLGLGPGAQEAVTRYAVLGRAPGVSLVRCDPATGRLHQIRAHLAHLGAPILGDREYGRRGDPLDARFRRAVGKRAIGLHAAALSLAHPTTGARIRLRAPLPDALASFFIALGLTCPRAWR